MSPPPQPASGSGRLLRVSRAAGARYHIWRGRPSSKAVGRYLCRAAMFARAPVGRVPIGWPFGDASTAFWPVCALARRPQGRCCPRSRSGTGAVGQLNSVEKRQDFGKGPQGHARLQPRVQKHHVQRARGQQHEHQRDLQPVAGEFENRPHDVRMMERLRARVSDDIFGFGGQGFRTRLRVDSRQATTRGVAKSSELKLISAGVREPSFFYRKSSHVSGDL